MKSVDPWYKRAGFSFRGLVVRMTIVMGFLSFLTIATWFANPEVSTGEKLAFLLPLNLLGVGTSFITIWKRSRKPK